MTLQFMWHKGSHSTYPHPIRQLATTSHIEKGFPSSSS
jgi:hypothetical protein